MARLISLLAGLLVAAMTPAVAAAGPKAVIELFTSQGCSSCTAADGYFAELARRDDVLALSLHVDYWDYLGWKDTLGSPAHTDRQRDYAEMRGTSRVYTPQMTVNGTTDFVGSDRARVEGAIDEARLPVPVTMRREGGTLEIEVGGSNIPAKRPTTIRLVLFSSQVRVAIEKGENAGSTMDYVNVVREIRPVGMWDGAPVRITLPEDEIIGNGIDGCAVIVQEDLANGPEAILGAAQLDRW